MTIADKSGIKPGPSEATPSTAGSVREALKGMLRLFDDQGNLVSDFQQLQSAIEAGYAALSVLARSEK